MQLDIEKYKTGDVILFSSCVPSNILIKIFSSSEWSHAGIIIRIDKNKKITNDNTGKIYILETNVRKTYDDIFGYDTKGLFFSDFEIIKNFHSKIMIRELKEQYRTIEFCESLLEYAKEYQKLEFPKGTFPFLMAWIGFSYNNKNKSLRYDKMFCSEFIANLYVDCINKTFEKNITIKNLLNNIYPDKCDVCKPDHFSYSYSPDSIFFEKGQEYMISETDLISIILFPIILMLAIIIFIYMTLPKK